MAFMGGVERAAQKSDAHPVNGSGRPYPVRGGAQLRVASVEEFDLQRARINAVHTAHIDRHHLVAFGIGAFGERRDAASRTEAVSYTHLRAHETPEHLVCRLLLE